MIKSLKQFGSLFFMLGAALPALSNTTHASDFKMQFPIECNLNQNCFISSYFDLDRRDGYVSDYTCGTNAKDNQNGIHISLKNYLNTKLNFNVLAAADGEIIGLSDGLSDLVIDSKKLPQFKGSACGNGILIEHEGGWFTRYCHLRKESTKIALGDRVKKGQPIGIVGSSGRTDWPRLDFSVSRNNYLFDPFSGKTTLERCGGSVESLWDKPIDYSPFAIMDTGFVIGPPNTKNTELGTQSDYNYIPVFTPDLSLWAMVMNIRKGDRLILSILDPNGFVFNEIDEEIDFNAERYVIYLYTKKKNILWDAGTYTGTVKIIRYDGGETYETYVTNDVELYESDDR